jgi:hypothetical protein
VEKATDELLRLVVDCIRVRIDLDEMCGGLGWTVATLVGVTTPIAAAASPIDVSHVFGWSH